MTTTLRNRRRVTRLASLVLALVVATGASLQGQTYSIIHSFQGGTDGGSPWATLVRDKAGNLYGTTEFGGIPSCDGYDRGCGTVFKLDKSGKETVLYRFKGGKNPAYPTVAGVHLDSVGNLYGTTPLGGNTKGVCSLLGSCGTVFKVDKSGNATVLYRFKGGADGASPLASLIRDAAGNFYGTTFAGGERCSNGSYGCGTVFKVNTTGQVTILHRFKGGADGAFPVAVSLLAGGNLYGTTSEGGDPSCNHGFGCGTVFKMDKSGNVTVLYSFTGIDGAGPGPGLIRDSAGNLYGVTESGGTFFWGNVFKLDPAGHETVLYSFTGGADGSLPYGGLVRDSAGNLYGTTIGGGGDPNCFSPFGAGCGTVFKLDPTGIETVLHSFHGSPDDGKFPEAGLMRDAAGNLYGTALEGGDPTCVLGQETGCGVVFKLTP